MRSALLATVLVAGAASSAHADTRKPREVEKWERAVDGVVAAGKVVQAWTKIGAPAALDGAWIAMRVRVRQFLKAGEEWLASLAADVGPKLEVPDLAVLTAEPIHGIESSGYGWRVDPINDRKKFHKGTDYKADRGTPVHAAGDGVIVFTGRQQGYGKVIYLDHGGGLITRYAHLSKISVDVGDSVTADSVIGKVGSTGRTTGPHLHFEIRVDQGFGGRAIDPVLGLLVAELQRTDPTYAWLPGLALLPEVQKHAVDAHDPPPGMKKSRKRRPSS